MPAGRSISGLPSWANHYPYQDGLLVWYWDEGMADKRHEPAPRRGSGAPRGRARRAAPPRRPLRGANWTFSPWSSTIQTYDAPFGLEPTDAIKLPFAGTLPPAAGSPAGTPNRVIQFEITHPSLPGVAVFNDNNAYWYPATPTASVIVPQTGTTIRVVSTSAQGSFMQVQVAPAK